MHTDVEQHYAGSSGLAARIKEQLVAMGKDVERLATTDLATVDEFHIRGRQATLELGERMALSEETHVLDIGAGLGGPARTLAERYGCRVTGIDVTKAFCEAATIMSDWVGLGDRLRFVHGDACSESFDRDTFDAAASIHISMNVPDKNALYANAKRVLKPDGVLAVYEVLQGEGGPVEFPVPWARDPAISHLATPAAMADLLTKAGFQVIDEHDSTDESLEWFEELGARMEQSGPPPLGFQLFLGEDFPVMARNQIKNLAEDRIRTVTYICRA